MGRTRRYTRAAAVIVFGALISGTDVSAQGAAEPEARIPLREGLMVVTALSGPAGDAESIKRVTAINDFSVKISYSKRNKGPQGFVNAGAGARTVRRADLLSAREYRQMIFTRRDVTFPGTTAIGASAAVLADLKTKGESEFAARVRPEEDSLAGLVGGLLSDVQGMPGMDLPEMKAVDDLDKISGTIKTAGRVRFPVIVNNTRVELAAVRATGRLGEVDTEFVFLDDPENPLTLYWKVGKDSLAVVRLSFPVESAAQQIADALAKSGRAEIQGIYFDFREASLRPESEAVLKDVAAVLLANPTWTMNIEGHTDNVGGDAANLDLSRRRASAVKQALVERHRVDAARLSTAGFGAARPKETNDTLAGRARNRRVELVRLGKDGQPATGAVTAGATTGSSGITASASGGAGGAKPEKVLFRDDFSDKNSGWEAYSSDDEDSDYYAGAFKIRLADGGMSHVPLEGTTFDDARFEIDITKKTGGPLAYAGLNIRFNDAKGVGPTFYRFLIRDDGAVAADAVNYKGYNLRVPTFTANQAVKTGVNAVNHLTVEAVGSTFTFHVNGVKVASFTDAGTRAGIVRLVAGGEKGMLQIAYDNFVVTRP